MYPVSDRYKASLAAGQHQIAVELDIIRGGTLTDPSVAVLDGSLDIDATSSVRRHGTVTVEGARDDLDPYGTEVAIRAGIVFPDGSSELVPIGVFSVQEPAVTDDGAGVVTKFDIFDRAKSIAKRRLPRPYPIAAGINLGTAIQDLLRSRRPDLLFQFVTTTATAPAGVLEEQADGWEKALQMAQAAGMDLFFDPTGVDIMRPVTSIDAAEIAWSYVEGAGCTMTKVSRQRSTEQTYSHAIVTAETTDGTPAVRADAYDLDPGSPTYIDGPFGDQPTWLRSPFITTQQEVDVAAAALLARSSGLNEGLELSAVPNFALDANDLVLVQRAALGVDDIYALKTITLPFGVEAEMRATTRTKRRVAV